MAEWYYAPEGRTEGPVPLESLVRLLQGAIPPDTPVWKDGFASWVAANTVTEITAHLPARPAAAAATPGAAAVATVTAVPAGAAERSLNPLVIFRRCFSWRGRFTRGEYLVAIGTGLLVTLAFYALVGLAMVLGAGVVAGILLGLLALLWLPTSFILGFGSAVRRLNDLGASSWLLLLMMVPLVNMGLLIYMLAVPGNPKAVLPTRTPVGALVIMIATLVLAAGGIVAAIAIPGLIRARVAGNEASAIGGLRAITSAQATFASSTGGGSYASRIECLVTPGACVSGYSGPAFLSPDFAEPVRSGYVFTLYAGAPAEGAGAIPGSSATYAVVAVPHSPETGGRSFCADASGRILDASTLVPDDVVQGAGEQAQCNALGIPIQ